MNARNIGIGIVVTLSGLAVVAGGCASPEPNRSTRPKSTKYVNVPPPKAPPAVPPRAAVAFDSTMSSTARREVAEALRSSNPLVRTQALEALRANPGAEGAKQFVTAMNDPHPAVRFAAVMLAGETQSKDAYSAVLKRVDDPNLDVQVAARFALHKLGDRRRTHDLERFAVSNDPRVRRNVALVLGLLGEPSALKVLQTMKFDTDALVRQQSLEAMWRLGDQEALKGLVGLTASRYADDKIFGLLALAAPKRQLVREHVRGLLAGDDVHTEVSLVAARAMGMLDSDEGYAVAQNGARSQDPNQRFLAALAFGAIGRPDAQDELRKLLSDPEPNVQLAAASAVLQLSGARG